MKIKNTLFIISFLEGSALMAAEIISAKIMAPYYGNSLVVWTSVFVCTLTGLAIGYFIGGILSSKSNLEKKLIAILFISTIFFLVMSPLANFIMGKTLPMSIEIGSFISIFVFLFPLLLSFGLVSPIVIQLLSKKDSEAGEKSGKVYTISTIGGILSTLLFGFYLIPYIGIKISILIATLYVGLACCFSIYYKINKD